MRKKDLTVPALLLEAVVIILAVAYIILQISSGIYYHRSPLTIVLNTALMLLIYAFFTILSIYPDRVNRLPEEVCQGNIRKYTLRMVRIEKLILTAGLLIPSIFDVLGRELYPVTSVIFVIILLAPAVVYEGKIIHELRGK